MIPQMIYHSDDYGISEYSCQQILNCCDHGKLQSVAILPNSSYFDTAVQTLRPYVVSGKLAITVHLNLVEGPSITPIGHLPHLTDEKGYFKLSFGQLLLQTMLSPRGPLVQEIRTELKNQILKIRNSFPDTPIGLDSHQHFHMIPAVFRTVVELIPEAELTLTHLRFADEPLLPFLKEPSLYASYRPINLIKNLTLKVLGWKDRTYLKGTDYNIPLFFGLMLSGHMDRQRVEKLLPHFCNIAANKKCSLEILSHPGGIRSIDECMDPNKKGFVEFYLSEGRSQEAHMLFE